MIGEFNVGTSSSLILLLFLLVNFGTPFRGGNVWKGICGPFLSNLKKPRQWIAFASESEVLALGETTSESELLGQSSGPPGQGSHMPSSKSNEPKS